MKRASQWLILALVLAALSVLVSPTQGGGRAEANAPKGQVRILVGSVRSAGPAVEEAIRQCGGTVTQRLQAVSIRAARVPPECMAILASTSGVTFVEEDKPVRALADTVPWGVQRVAGTTVGTSFRGQGVKVAILDTGIDLAHPDLVVAGHVSFVEGVASGQDDNGHGTAIAGVVGALDNGTGIRGVAPGAALYAVKVLNQNAAGTSFWVALGIDWAMVNGMQVITLSIQASCPNITLETMIQEAYKAGIVVVAAAGNNGNAEGTGDNVVCPARTAEAIAVGATDENNVRASWSSTGPALDLVAPGVNILTTALGGGYTTVGGTSYSAPHVAGLAALYVAEGFGFNTQIVSRLQQMAQDLGAPGRDDQYGYGLANVNNEPILTTWTPISITVSGTGTPPYYTSIPSVSLAVRPDWTGTAVASIRYSINEGAWNSYTGPFELGTWGRYVVISQGLDAQGNVIALGVGRVVYFDPVTPSLTIAPDPSVLRPPNGKMVDVVIGGSAWDDVSGLVYGPVWVTVTDEYGLIGPYTVPLGATVQLEAKRNPADKDGRTYTCTATVTDRAGNSKTTVAQVVVP